MLGHEAFSSVFHLDPRPLGPYLYKSQATCGTQNDYYRCFLPDLTGFIAFTLRRARLFENVKGSRVQGFKGSSKMIFPGLDP